MSDRALLNPASPNRAIVSLLIWVAIAGLGAFAFAGIALNREEPVSAAWLVTAAICVYLVAYRFYSKFIAERVLRLDETRMTPAERHDDGLDYVPTNKYVVFGHHFAAIAGAGPLVGPVLAARWVTYQELYGSSWASCLPAPCRISLSYSARCDAMAAHSAKW
jgi:carbon starvation protein